MWFVLFFVVVFFFNDTATTEIYTLSLHDALPISCGVWTICIPAARQAAPTVRRSEEHTSELQSPMYLVCRLLLEKKKKSKRELIYKTKKKKKKKKKKQKQ